MPVEVEAEVLANERLAPDYNVLALAASPIAACVEPGQFIMVRPADGFDPLLRRPFSVFEILREADGRVTGVSLLNKAIGIGTRRLLELQPGDRLPCLGPLGRPFVPVDPPAHAWMIAGGVGLAPFATLAAALKQRGTSSTLFYGARNAGDLFYLDRFERLGVRLVLATENGSLGTRGFVTVPLERELDAAPPSQDLVLYACGPTPMMRAVARLATAYRRRCQVSLEPVMGCGLGGCYSCVVPVRRNGRSHFVRGCLEGPVFDAATLDWTELSGH